MIGNLEHSYTDVLVLGGGLAGYRAALAAKQAGVDVTITYRGRGASPYVTGFNVPLDCADTRDSPQVFFDDMVRGGYGLNDRRLVRALAEKSIDAFGELTNLGVKFAQGPSSAANGTHKVLQRHLSGNTYPRSVYVPEGTGRAILSVLVAQARACGIHIIAGYKVVNLLRDGDEVVGALMWKPNAQNLIAIHARAVVVAMGGIGRLYSDSTYPADVSADAFGLAFDAGARLIDMEFVQFEPVVTVWPEACRGMEMPTAMLGEGAQLRNALGERFMLRYNPVSAERGIEKAKLALYIQQEIDEGRGFPEGGVLFDTTLLSVEQLEGYVTHCKRLRAAGFDPVRRAPLVAPAAHSIMGGVFIDDRGWSGVTGLYVGGEAAGGVHGASRLAGNGSSDTLVFGAIAGRSAALELQHNKKHDWTLIERQAMVGLIASTGAKIGAVSNFKDAIRRILSRAAGIWRSRDPLLDGIDALGEITDSLERAAAANIAQTVTLIETRHMATVAEAILRAALARTESRGAHQRTDFREADDVAWLRHISFRRGGNGGMIEETLAIQ